MESLLPADKMRRAAESLLADTEEEGRETHAPRIAIGSVVGEVASDAETQTSFLTADTTAPPTEHDEVAPKKKEVVTVKAPTRIKQYEIIRELGRGGMGVVYLARDTKLGRRVAIKVLTPRYGDEAERFLIEARATASCNHEHIVVIHEVGIHSGAPYMVLEHLDGEPLNRHLNGGTLPPAKALEIAIPIAKALVHAHQFGIVHRDLKPENIFITKSGSVKVLDFGIAKAVSEEDGGADSGKKMVEGTPPYMAPEQWQGCIDARSDIWAVGLILYRMLTAGHPAPARRADHFRAWATALDEDVKSIQEDVVHLPDEVASIVDQCLQKRLEHRFANAKELLTAMEAIMPGRRSLDQNACPYPGLAAFQQSDADRYFGRDAEIRRAMAWLQDRPILAVVGPSGLGKSSFVRAGLMPALSASGEHWQVETIRPGRNGLSNLASLCHRLDNTSRRSPELGLKDHADLVEKLREQPGFVGASLRAQAEQKECQILVFVDQFEELYTLQAPEDRIAFTNCLLGMADDPASPLRVVLSMRSDFLDRVAESPDFSEEMTAGLMLLAPLNGAALRNAITQPAELAGYQFEDPSIVTKMVSELETTQGALSLLQFAASRLWDTRDKRNKKLTAESYEAMGGIAGTLAAHADSTLAGMSSTNRRLTRAIFERLVTPERTRAIVDMSELMELGDSDEVARLVQQLVQSRLLVSDNRDSSQSTVELVHESLITSWPTLHRWLDEDQEDSAFLAQLRDVARQWQARGEPSGLLWRGEALDEARRFASRYRGQLAAREQAYLEAAFRLGDRATRRKRAAIIGAFTTMAVMVVLATGATFTIREAEKTARAAEHSARAAERVAKDAERQARQQAVVAQSEAERALEAEKKIGKQLEVIKAKEAAQREAEQKALDAAERLAASHNDLKVSNGRLHTALSKAETASAAERQMRLRIETLLEKEQQRVKELERMRGKIIDRLE